MIGSGAKLLISGDLIRSRIMCVLIVIHVHGTILGALVSVLSMPASVSKGVGQAIVPVHLQYTSAVSAVQIIATVRNSNYPGEDFLFQSRLENGSALTDLPSTATLHLDIRIGSWAPPGMDMSLLRSVTGHPRPHKSLKHWAVSEWLLI